MTASNAPAADASSGEPIQLVLTLPDDVLEQLAARLVDLIHQRLEAAAGPPSPWLDFEAARAYLGFSRDRLYKLTAARAIPCRKKAGGQGLLFHQGELDHWLKTSYPRLDQLP